MYDRDLILIIRDAKWDRQLKEEASEQNHTDKRVDCSSIDNWGFF